MACARIRWTRPGAASRTTTRGSTPEIDLSGELDISDRSAVWQVIDDVFELRPKRVVLDLSRLTFMDSTGVHLVKKLRDRAAATDTELVLVPGPPAIQRVFAVADAVNHSLAFTWAEAPSYA